MNCKEQLSRWLLKRLINRFTNASLTQDHHFLFSNIKIESGMLRAKTDNDNRKKLLSALNELVKKGAISDIQVKVVEKIGKKIINVKYTIKQTIEFIREQKAAGKRKTNVEKIAKNVKLKIVDKSKIVGSLHPNK